MSDEEPVVPRRYRHAGLTEEEGEKLMSLMRPKSFSARTLIAEPGRPVTGVYCVQRGVIAVSDDVVVDMGRRGILLESGDTFGEYSLMDKIRALPKELADRSPLHWRFAAEEVRPFPSGLRALTDVETLYLPADQYPAAAAAFTVSDAVQVVVQRVFLNERIPSLVDALKQHPKLRTVAPYQLIDLAQRGEAIALAKDAELFTQLHDEAERRRAALLARYPERKRELEERIATETDEQRRKALAESLDRHEEQHQRLEKGPEDDLDPADWFYLARGTLKVDRAVMFPGSVFRCQDKGSYISEGEDAPAGGEAGGPCWLVRIKKRDLDEFSKHSFLVASCPWNTRPLKDPPPPPSKKILLVTDRNERTHPTPLSALTTVLANTLQRELPKTGKPKNDHVGLLAMVPRGTSVAKLSDAQQSARAVGVNVLLVAEDVPTAELVQKCQLLADDSDPVLLDIDARSMKQHLERLGKDRDQLRPDKVAFIAHHPFAKVPPDFEECPSIVRCVLLRQSAVGEYLPYYPRTVRLAFDDLERIGALDYRKLPDRDLASISRLGRAVTERRVGVALGGGGAWGFAHIALLQELRRVEMPVDVVSGVSFGSLAGGFFAAGGLPVLQEVMNKRQMLQWTLLAGSLLPPVVEWYLDSLLEAQRLEYLETTFLPVGLNLNTGEEWSPGIGSVASGIRAASSLPGFFSPYLAKGVRSVDGVYINNVPEGILTREGADFIISSDVAETPKVPEQKNGWWQHVWNWTGISRMQDNMRALAFATKVADDRDKGMSNAQFRPQQAGVPPWDFSKGHLIKTNAENGAARFADEVRKQWATEWMRV
jgi:predicted acylesterase/phospholipase RssA/CRP-like cAMP-binding protein